MDTCCEMEQCFLIGKGCLLIVLSFSVRFLSLGLISMQ